MHDGAGYDAGDGCQRGIEHPTSLRAVCGDEFDIDGNVIGISSKGLQCGGIQWTRELYEFIIGLG